MSKIQDGHWWEVGRISFWDPWEEVGVDLNSWKEGPDMEDIWVPGEEVAFG